MISDLAQRTMISILIKIVGIVTQLFHWLVGFARADSRLIQDPKSKILRGN